jgi:hypothetical protein
MSGYAMPGTIRTAVPADAPALVRLRLAGAEKHVQLGSAIPRLAAPDAVRPYLEDVRCGPDRTSWSSWPT